MYVVTMCVCAFIVSWAKQLKNTHEVILFKDLIYIVSNHFSPITQISDTSGKIEIVKKKEQ